MPTEGLATVRANAGTRAPSGRRAVSIACRSLFTLLLIGPAPHAEPFTATLIAERDCPATVGIKRADNPGAIRLVPGQGYPVVATNKADATHYLLRIADASPVQRWVELDCGHLASSEPPDAPPRRASTPGPYLLAVSWQPAFCERRPRVDECRDQSVERADARQFSLHGLWPQPIDGVYCGVDERDRRLSRSGDWGRLPVLALQPQTRARLETLMPGTRSHLQRHEWTKHGTCYGSNPERYFRDSMALLDQLNASEVRARFVERIGGRLRASEIRDAFDRAFGKGSGERVQLVCEEGLISELRIGLKGIIAERTPLGALIRAAPVRGPGCRGGRVDRAGID